jgi:hypothetical protein
MPKYIKTRLSVCNQRAVAVNFVQNDSVYIHGKDLVTGRKQQDNSLSIMYVSKNRYERKCDSLIPVQKQP